MVTVNNTKINRKFEKDYYTDYSPMKRNEKGEWAFQKKISEMIQEFIDDIEVKCLICPKCETANAVKHGYYERYLRTALGMVKIKVLRIKCLKCGKTHAVLPLFVVPYSWTMLRHQIMIIRGQKREAMEQLTSLCESEIYYIKKQYRKYWEQKILSESIQFDESISERCFDVFGKQFMQIRGAYNCIKYI